MSEETFKPTMLAKRMVLREDCLKKGIYHIATETIKIRGKKDFSKILGGKKQKVRNKE